MRNLYERLKSEHKEKLELVSNQSVYNSKEVKESLSNHYYLNRVTYGTIIDLTYAVGYRGFNPYELFEDN